MKIGLFLSTHLPPGGDAVARRDAVVDQAVLAEQLGFDSLFLGHHYLASSAFFQPLSVASYLAARTERIRLGFGILLGPLLPPVALAEELATLDVLSGGRLTVGLGTGYREKEYAAVGVPYEERFRRIEEGVRLMRRLWAGESVTEDGLFGSVKNATLHLQPLQDGGPPIWLGAFAARGVRRVAELDASWLMAGEGDDATIAERLELLREQLTAHGHGLDRAYPLMREACIRPNREDAMKIGRDHLLPQFKAYRSWETAQKTDPDALLRDHSLIGTPEDALERLRGWHELGITDVIMRFDWHGMPDDEALESIRLLGTEVLPEARSWG